jgi:succinoglycan biosynthesis transport protein ExoP
MKHTFRAPDRAPEAAPDGFMGPAQDEDAIDLSALVRMLWSGKWIILGSTLLFLMLGYFYATQQTPTYRATATVIFDLQQTNVANIDEVVAARDYERGADLQNQIEVLRSTALIERVIEKLNLVQNPEFNPAEAEPEPGLFDWLTLPPEVQTMLQSWGLMAADPPPPNPALQQRRLRLAMIDRVRDGLQLTPVRNSTVIRISFVSINPNTAQSIANAIADQYIVEQLEGKLEATRSATEWLSERVLQLQQQVTDAEAAVSDAEAQLAAAAGQTLEITQAQLTELNSALGAARAREIALSSQVYRLREALDSGANTGAIPEFRQTLLIQTYREQESDLLSQRASLLASVSEGHPSVRRLDAQLADVRGKIREEANRVVESFEVQLETARAEAAELARQVRDLEEKSLEQSADEIALRQLERQAQASRLLYENFLGRLQETSQQESLQTADARVISPAEVPRFAMSGGKRRILAVAGIAGLLLGIGIVFMLDRLNNTFRGPRQAEEELGLPVLASIPLVPGTGNKRRKILEHFRDKPGSALAESVRGLRTSILFSNVDRPPKVVVMSSSVPREGKSTTAVLLAQTSQQMGRKTIIVDCDMRLPAIPTLLDYDTERPGLMAALNAPETLDEAISVEPDTGLHILTIRRRDAALTQNAADILSSQKFRTLINTLRDRYDFVVLDTPPTLVVSDARIIAGLADGLVFSVKWDDTPRGAAAEAIKQLRSIGAPLTGIVMTMVNEAKAAQYAYDGYGYGYYGGQYKDYYVD